MNITLRYFASIREALGTSSQTWQTQVNTVAALRDELMAQGGAYPEALARGKAIRVAVNQVMVEESAVLSDGAEVAFFPPVTGG
jgi:sulfur-carrier protein